MILDVLSTIYDGQPTWQICADDIYYSGLIINKLSI